MKITRLSDVQFMVDTGDLTADLRPISGICILSGRILRSRDEGKGVISLCPPVVVKLGPVSYERVLRMAIGQTFEAEAK